MALVLPKPELVERELNGISMLTDDALASSVGVRVAFTNRVGGQSFGPYSSLNLGSHVGDSLSDVLANRGMLACGLGADPDKVIVPNQVHGDGLITVSSCDAPEIERLQALAAEGADGILVESVDVAALLCAADCALVTIVSPTGRFAVVHAGWRGAVAGISGKAVRGIEALDVAAGALDTPSRMNVYVGPHIHVECFETGSEVSERFVDAFGQNCVVDGHVDLSYAISSDVERAGVDPSRIEIAPYCTKCNPEKYFSYRDSGGVCGRHGAFAVRLATQ